MFHLPIWASPGLDLDTAGLHGFGDFANHADLEQTVFEGRSGNLDMVGQIELAAERPRRNTLMQVVPLGLVGLAVTVISSGKNPATASVTS
jgi:hypothetical protein